MTTTGNPGVKKYQRLFWIKQLGRFLIDPFLPRDCSDEESLSETTHRKIPAEQVEQSKSIFEQSESRRRILEEKARSTFSTISFLVPFLGSTFLFLLQRTVAASPLQTSALILSVVAAVMLGIAFTSIVRAVAVKTLQMPFVDAVLDRGKNFEFREYNSGRQALLYLHCAMANEKTNDGIAQFVKGSHILTALAVGAYFLAAVLAGIAHVDTVQPIAEVKLEGPVEVRSPDLAALRPSLDQLSADILALSQREIATDKVDVFRMELQLLEARLEVVEKHLAQKQKSKKPTK